MVTVEGWILDVRKTPSGVDIWVKTTGGEVRRFARPMCPSFFVYGRGANLSLLGSTLQKRGAVTQMEEVTDFFSGKAVSALRVLAPSPAALPSLVRSAARIAGEHGLYSCDIPLEQLFFYETGTFPLCRCVFAVDEGGVSPGIRPLESDWDLGYEIPPLTVMYIRPLPEKRVNPFQAPWASLELSCEGSAYELEWCEERAFLLEINRFIRDFEPDIVVSEWGDEYIFPRLFKLSRKVGASVAFFRETGEGARCPPTEGRGRSFFSYGKMVYRASSVSFPGRPHIDVMNSFFYGEVGLDGIIQLARISKIPLERLSRTSPGTVISAMEVEHAWKRDIAVPYKKRQTEFFKSADELVVVDKGGLVYMPPVGVFESVCELDFASMYPNLMVEYNISPETLMCACCENHRIPETGTHTCTRRRGLIPAVLEPVLEMRRTYKDMRRRVQGEERAVYNSRQTALKWILVVCFGFLGYRNARFGRIEAHEAVTAYGREKLLAAKEIAEREGYRFIHGLTDALWVRKEGASDKDYRSLAGKISAETGIEIAVEGMYRWIAFLPSRRNRNISVPGRFVGIFKGGEMKTRGIASRRRDTPRFIKRMQEAMLAEASSYRTVWELKGNGEAIKDVFSSFLDDLKSGAVSPQDLAICRRLSKPPGAYTENTAVAQVVRELAGRGIDVKPGEVVWYVITGEGEKARSLGFYTPDYSLDRSKYLQMVEDAAGEILQILELPVY
jgi:DNA polymerase-2